MAIYIGYFILNEKHKGGGSANCVADYYESIVVGIRKFVEKSKTLLLWLDGTTKERVLNMIDIEIPSNIIILDLNYEDTYMYKTHYHKFQQQILDNEITLAPWRSKCDLEIESSLTNEERISRHTDLLKTLLIWNTKFELFRRAKEYILDNNLDFSHICYLDIGAWRPDRIRYMKHFYEASFNIHTLNKINVNFDPRLWGKPINYEALLYDGAWEVGANHLCLSISIADDFFEEFERTFASVDNAYKLITSEQRYLRLMLSKYNVEDITCTQNHDGCTYTIDFHNPPLSR